MRIEYKGLNFQRTGFKQGSLGEFEAVVSTFGNIDSYNERIVPGAFTKSIDRYEAEGRQFKVLWSHNPERPIGTAKLVQLQPGDSSLPEEMRANGGLMAYGKLAIDTFDGEQAAKHLTAGTFDEFSIGFFVKNDRIADDGVRELLELELFEVSPVVVGANRQTGLVSLKGGWGSFDDHAEDLNQLVQDFSERASTRYSLRESDKKAGRVLSSSNVAKLEALAGTLGKARKELLQMLENATPKPAEPKSLTVVQAKAILLSKGIKL
jgi:HK97 family phage prohead protease